MCTVSTVLNSGWQCVNSEEDIFLVHIHQHMLAVFDLLTISCKYSENGCEEKLHINEIHDHEKACKFSEGSLP